MNYENTWHRWGRRSSLLDIFYTNKPHRIKETKNIVNILSEHDGVRILLDCKAKIKNEQFITTRSYRNFTWENVETDINENHDLQEMFGETNPEIIAEKLLRGLNHVIKKHIVIKRVQLRKNVCP